MKPDSILGRVLVLVAVPSLMLLGLLAAFLQADRRQLEAQRWSLHTKTVLDEAQQLLTHLSDIQTGVRGYIIVREPVFLEAYRRARSELPQSLQRLQTLTADNPAQVERVRDFGRRSDALVAHYEAVLAPARANALSVEDERDAVVRGKSLVDEVRSAIAAFRQQEERLDSTRRADLERASRRTFAIVIGGTCASLFAVIALGVWFHRGLSRRVRRLTGTARLLAEGQDGVPTATTDDELAAVDGALRDMALTLAVRQRAAVGALGDAVTLFSTAGTRRAVLDVAADRALALAGASLAICTVEKEAADTQTVVAAAAVPSHPASVPVAGTDFSWSGTAEVVSTGRPVRLTASARAARDVPAEIERVLGSGEWLGVPLSDDRRTPLGVLQVVASPGRGFRDDDCDVVATVAHAASVALALEQSRQRLETANADLALTNRENELFIYSVSHDLRSPLVNLEGFSRELSTAAEGLRALVHEPDVPERVRTRAIPLIDDDIAESVRFIKTAVGRLAAIIDGLLRLSRAGRVDYRVQPLDLTRIVQRIVDAMHATVAAASAEVRFGSLPTVAGDALAVEQLFANLIGNALAYGRPGVPPRVDLAIEDDLARDPRFTVIRVSDNGLGIPDAHIEKVFQPLQRLHPGVGRGEGMGLAIVRRIVERHDGRVWVRSQLGAGTSFYVELPREPMEGLQQ